MTREEFDATVNILVSSINTVTTEVDAVARNVTVLRGRLDKGIPCWFYCYEIVCTILKSISLCYYNLCTVVIPAVLVLWCLFIVVNMLQVIAYKIKFLGDSSILSICIYVVLNVDNHSIIHSMAQTIECVHSMGKSLNVYIQWLNCGMCTFNG